MKRSMDGGGCCRNQLDVWRMLRISQGRTSPKRSLHFRQYAQLHQRQLKAQPLPPLFLEVIESGGVVEMRSAQGYITVEQRTLGIQHSVASSRFVQD